MKRLILSCDPIVAFNSMVNYCEKTKKDFELISKTEDSIDLKVFFGDVWSGKKILKFKVIRTTPNESEVYLSATAINPLTSGDSPIPLLQQKSVDRYLSEVVNYLQSSITQDVHSDKSTQKTEVNPNSDASIKNLIELDSREKTKNRNILKYFDVGMVLFFIVLYFVKDSKKYSVCECQPVVGYTTIIKSQEDKYSWCNRKYGGYSQEQLIDKCAEEIRKNTFNF